MVAWGLPGRWCFCPWDTAQGPGSRDLVGLGGHEQHPAVDHERRPRRVGRLRRAERAIAAAISRASPGRPAGMPLRSVPCGSSSAWPVIGVAISPGAIELTVMPCSASSSAIVFVTPPSPCLAATYGGRALQRDVLVDGGHVDDPPAAALRDHQPRGCWAAKNAPVKSVFNVAERLLVELRTGVECPVPALLTNASTPPSASASSRTPAPSAGTPPSSPAGGPPRAGRGTPPRAPCRAPPLVGVPGDADVAPRGGQGDGRRPADAGVRAGDDRDAGSHARAATPSAGRPTGGARGLHPVGLVERDLAQAHRAPA